MIAILCLSALYGCSTILRQENPVSEFTYVQDENGNIIITDYTGTKANVIIPEKINGRKVIAVGEYAFSEDQQITYVDIPNTVTVIGEYAFAYCNELKKVILSEGVEILGNSAFAACSKLENIEIPKTVKEIGDKVFLDCKSLKHAYISASVKYGGNVFMYSGIESAEIEEGVDVIPMGAFCYSKIKEIVLPKSVKVVGSLAFLKCEELSSVILNQGLEKIENNAFAFCPNLTEIIVPESVTKLDDGIFAYCQNLKSLKFEGNAPDLSETSLINTYCTVYFHDGADGFTSPEWNGCPAEIW